MPTLIDTKVTARSGTDNSEPRRPTPEHIAYDVDRSRRSVFIDFAPITLSTTVVGSTGLSLETSDLVRRPQLTFDWTELREANVKAWNKLGLGIPFASTRLDRLTGATKPTSTTVSTVAGLLRRYHRDERLRRMSPESRATYDRIRKLREEIGPVDFDVVRAIRELRNGD